MIHIRYIATLSVLAVALLIAGPCVAESTGCRGSGGCGQCPAPGAACDTSLAPMWCPLEGTAICAVASTRNIAASNEAGTPFITQPSGDGLNGANRRPEFGVISPEGIPESFRVPVITAADGTISASIAGNGIEGRGISGPAAILDYSNEVTANGAIHLFTFSADYLSGGRL